MTPTSVSSPAAVEAVLCSSSFAPPQAPTNLHEGPTLRLRRQMARFRPADTHANARRAVDELVAEIADHPFARDAADLVESTIDRARSKSTGSVEAITDLALVVPVEVMALALGVAGTDTAAVRNDVRVVAEVIGRGAESTTEVDDAVRRLEARFAPAETNDRAADTAATLSLLYQTHDATAALFAETLLADRTDRLRRSALSATVRVALERTTIDGHDVAPGDEVRLDLESSGLEFGAGPHHCPGRAIAEAIVAGMMAGFRRTGMRVDRDRIEFRYDERPTAIPLVSG